MRLPGGRNPRGRNIAPRTDLKSQISTASTKALAEQLRLQTRAKKRPRSVERIVDALRGIVAGEGVINVIWKWTSDELIKKGIKTSGVDSKQKGEIFRHQLGFCLYRIAKEYENVLTERILPRDLQGNVDFYIGQMNEELERAGIRVEDPKFRKNISAFMEHAFEIYKKQYGKN